MLAKRRVYIFHLTAQSRLPHRMYNVPSAPIAGEPLLTVPGKSKDHRNAPEVEIEYNVEAAAIYTVPSLLLTTGEL